MVDPESSVQSVISNDDLLTEILVRLPLLSLVLFKSVSKRWLSLIKVANVALLLVVKNDAHSRHFTIYEKGNMYSEWSVKYIVNLDDTIKLFSKRWSIYNNIFCIVLGEREEDSFLVLKLGKKVVQYKFVSKTLSTISDLGPNEHLIRCFQFIPSFANV